MLKITLAVLAVALAGTASAAGWRSMRIDASSEADFTASVSALQAKLPKARRHVLKVALQEIRVQGTQAAAKEQRDYPTSEHLRQLDGLKYKDIVTFTDPTGDAARRWYREASGQLYTPRQRKRMGGSWGPSWQADHRPDWSWPYQHSLDGANRRGGVAEIERNNEWSQRAR
jgi:hypothetical protein